MAALIHRLVAGSSDIRYDGLRKALTKMAESATTSAPRDGYPWWKFEDAEARFGEVVEGARTEGPQRIRIPGHDAVVVIEADDLARLLPASDPQVPFVAFMEGLTVDGLDLTRDRDAGRDQI